MAPKKKKLNKKALLRKQEEERRIQEEAARKEQEENRRKQEEQDRIRKEEEERVRAHENKIRDEESEELEDQLKQVSVTHYQRSVDAWENKRWNDYIWRTKEIDALDLRQVNSFITEWNEESDYEMENIFQKCHTCIQIIDEISCAMDAYPYEDKKAISLWQEGIENLKNAIAQKMDYASFMLLKNADQYLDEKSFNMEFGVRDERVTLLLWINLYTAVRSRGMDQKFGFEFQLPPVLVAEGCAVRVMQMAFGHAFTPRNTGHKVKDMTSIDSEKSEDIKDEKQELQTEIPTETTIPQQTNTTNAKEETEKAPNGNAAENNNITTVPDTKEHVSTADIGGENVNKDKPLDVDQKRLDENENKADNLSNQNENKIDDKTVQGEAKVDDLTKEDVNKPEDPSNQVKNEEKDENKGDDGKTKNELSYEAENKNDNQGEKMLGPDDMKGPVDTYEYFLVGGITHFDYLHVPKLTVHQSGVTYFYS